MMRSLLVTPLVLATLASPGPLLERDELAFGVVEGTELVRTIETSVSLELDEMAMIFNGEEVPADHFADVEESIEYEETLVVRDVFGTPGDGRPASLVRTYEELEGLQTFSSGEDQVEMEKQNGLEGLAVRFAWNEDDEEYELSWEDDEGDDDLFDGLIEDMDMRAFLPEGDVDEGDSWELETSAFWHVNRPGGIQLTDEERDENAEAMDAQMNENLDGTIEVTYAGTRDEDGVAVGVLEVVFEVSTFGEEELEMDEGPVVLRRSELAYELEGELLWDLEGGHLYSAALSGEATLVSNSETSFAHDGDEMEMVETRSFIGEFVFEITIERE